MLSIDRHTPPFDLAAQLFLPGYVRRHADAWTVPVISPEQPIIIHGPFETQHAIYSRPWPQKTGTPSQATASSHECHLCTLRNISYSPTPSRSSTSYRAKNVPKPEREVTRTEGGKFVCNWPSCKDEVKEFLRKCEWSKHMDKHDRPYKCTEDGCQKLPGFTYSGGFSRLENLNEHLRRVHTQNGGGQAEGVDSDGAVSEPRTMKRKRESADDDVREENKRLRLENEKLREQLDSQNHQLVTLMQQISQLQAEAEARGPVMDVTMPPNAPMQAMMAAGSNI
ncbi:hypothetical protein P8C59_004558 [Phyllachora maydis]|uniref:C2H2-type domain-containing protein n=1 Tax=Phyllachora maydis TaxID=1825666 RepID=A0AAD9MDM0_9PEZI|nr:hypothetical protein P8C59_004558 [Phyllachora maydis]